MDYDSLYEKAITERHHHYQNFNHWMNMYAIFNGALLVALYSVLSKGDSLFLKFLATVIFSLGTISGWSWFCSVCGYYRWIISWINVVSWLEGKTKIEKGENPYYLYRTFSYKKDSDNKNFKFPFSTQKLTKRFTFAVAVSWSFAFLVYVSKIIVIDIFGIVKLDLCKKYILLILVGLVLLFTIVFLIFSICVENKKFYCRENLSNTHKALTNKSDDSENSKILLSEQFEFEDFN